MIEQGPPWVESDIQIDINGHGGAVSGRANPKVAMLEEYERQQAIIEAERAARQAELRRLEALPFEELSTAQCIIVHGSDYPLCPGATPVADLFPEHGGGVPALYSDPDADWDPTVEEIIRVSEPFPTPDIGQPANGQMIAIGGPAGGTPGQGAGMGLATLAVLLL